MSGEGEKGAPKIAQKLRCSQEKGKTSPFATLLSNRCSQIASPQGRITGQTFQFPGTVLHDRGK